MLAAAEEPLDATPTVQRNPLNVPTQYELSTGLQVEYYRFFQRHQGDYDIYGEYRNNSQQRMIAPALRLVFSDEGRNIYWADYTSPVENFIGPGETGVFYARFPHSAWQQIQGSEILLIRSCETSFFGPAEFVDLEITGHSLVPSYTGDSYSGIVQVANTGSHTSEQPVIYAVSRDEFGMVDRVDFDFLAYEIEPGTFVRDQVMLQSVEYPSTTTFGVYEFGQLSVGGC
jgi:hypothetical protein